MARTPSRRHGALAAILVAIVITTSQSLAPRVVAGSADTARIRMADITSAAPRALSAAQLSRTLTREVYGYLPYWELDATTAGSLRDDLLSTISLFSFRYDSDGTILTTTASELLTGPLGQQVVAHAHAAGVRVELAFSFSGSVSPNDAFFSDATAQARAISQTLALVGRMGADGVNLDVERLSNAKFPAYGAFAGALRKAIRARDPVGRVTVATNGAGSGALMAAKAIANGVDRVFLMAYSYRSSGSSPVGSNAPVEMAGDDWDITSSLAEYARRGVPMDRLILGLPYYGLTRPTVDASLHAKLRTGFPSGTRPCAWNPSTPTFFVRDQGKMPASTTFGYDSVEETAWAVSYDTAAASWCQTYFESPRSLRAKYDLVVSAGLAGSGIWALGYDQGRSGYWGAIAASFSVARIAGPDRYATAAAVSASSFPAGVPVAYVATGRDFPDALAAGPVAAADGGPILLVGPSSIPASTAAELRRLRPDRIVVIGGPSAVDAAVLSALRPFAIGGTVDRVGGADRYATAAALSKATFGPGVDVAYVTTGLDFPDALSASGAGGTAGGPVLLVRPDGVPAATATELGRLEPSSIVVLGGPAVVSDAVLTTLRTYAKVVVRVAGSDRYATSAALSARTYAPGVPVAYVATGRAFPDALSGGPLAADDDGPLLLVGPRSIPASIVAELERLKPRRIVVLGGPAAIDASVLARLRDIVAAQ